MKELFKKFIHWLFTFETKRKFEKLSQRDKAKLQLAAVRIRLVKVKARGKKLRAVVKKNEQVAKFLEDQRRSISRQYDLFENKGRRR